VLNGSFNDEHDVVVKKPKEKEKKKKKRVKQTIGV
jgi:hypothetical protein